MFKPVHGAHAVVEAVFFFEFASSILSDEAIEEHLAVAYADALARVDRASSIELSFDCAAMASEVKCNCSACSAPRTVGRLQLKSSAGITADSVATQTRRRSCSESLPNAIPSTRRVHTVTYIKDKAIAEVR
ncbi:hypothetical protein [Pseudomonas sp. NFX98]|uniref:hypothetical protein n=1 Tax=Pseudomonas sp. NFX98 TaxID=3399122 RepID=UPI0039FCB796